MVMADTNDKMEATSEGENRRKPENEVRRRKKNVYKSLRAQMEFYFGDASLSKDRFLSNLVVRDKYVDLSIFLRFNKIRSLTSNISDIAKSLRDSELLSVTEDGLKVYRKTPVKYKENEDECTIYVEQLPPDADHEWLKHVFSSYGEVVYVSIPKYKPSNKIKGFAFVEFETPEAANKTLEAFGAMGCRLPAQMPPDNLCSIATFEKPEEGNENVENTATASVKAETLDSELPVDKKKRKLEQPDSSIDSEAGTDTEPSKKKKRKKQKSTEGEETLQEDEKDEQPLETVTPETASIKHGKKRKSKDLNPQKQESDAEGKTDKKTSSSDVPVSSSADELESAATTDSKPKKKKEEQKEDLPIETASIKHGEKGKSKDLNPQKQESDAEGKTDKKTLSSDVPDVPVSSSADELESGATTDSKPKEKKEEQKEDMPSAEEFEMDSDCVLEESNTETTIEDLKKKKKKNRNRNCKKKVKRESDPKNLGLKILSKREWKRLRNKYLDLQRNKMKAVKQHLARARWSGQTPRAHSEDGDGTPSHNQQPQPPQQPDCPRTVFTPGVIARVVLEEPVVDVPKFKSNMRAHPDVQYVDVLQGANEAFVRFSNSTSAEKFVKEESFGTMGILTGEEETNYWNKIMQDRTAKFSQKVKVKQRGRDKLLKRVERELGKHIRFDE